MRMIAWCASHTQAINTSLVSNALEHWEIDMRNLEKIKRKPPKKKTDNTRRERQAIRDSKVNYYEERDNEQDD